jgi:hypothetical protein
MATFNWGTVGSVVTLLSTELNSLADGSGSALGAEFNNSTNAQLAILWLTIASNSLAFTAASQVYICFVPSTTPDAAAGTYPTYTSGSSYKLAESNYIVASIFVNPTTQSANVVNETIPNVLTPPGYSKPLLINKTGVAFPASGNTLKLYRTPTQVA